MYRRLCAYLELLVLKALQRRLSSDIISVSPQLNEYIYGEREREWMNVFHHIEFWI